MGVAAPVASDTVIATAISQIGVHEDPPKSNRQPYGAWYGTNGVAWCAMFVSWCLHHAGFPLAITTAKGYAYCPYGVDFFKKHGAWAPAGTRPKRGWIVFFDFPGDGVNRVSHTGIVEGVLADGRVATIEGNTNPAGGRTGGEVMRHNRSVAGGIVGYGIVDYVGATPAPPTGPVGPVGTSLASGQGIGQGQSLVNGEWSLHHQPDGNVVLYQGPAGIAANARWSTGTQGEATRALTMQADGNLVLDRAVGGPLWTSDTPGNSGARCDLQSDGNIGLRLPDGTVIWDRIHGKVHRPAEGVPPFPLAAGHWFGITSPDSRNHSGYWESDRPLIAKIIDRLRARGWAIARGDRYTTAVAAVIVKFQTEENLTPDGRVGATTWRALWTAPIS